MSAHPRLSINQATIKYAPFDDALALSRAAGVQSLGVWRETVAELGLDEAARRLNDSGLRISSLCRAGFFTRSADPAGSFADNCRAIEETAVLAAAGAAGSAAVLVLVAGGIPDGSTDLIGARALVRDAIGALAPIAAAAGVTLAVEALHPMYASDRAVVSTLGQALDIAEQFSDTSGDGTPTVGVVVDSFHVWWDPQVQEQIARAGATNRIASYQVSDWATPLAADVLLSRHYMGDGVIDLAGLTAAVSAAGYTGDVEVEIFNQPIWDSAWAAVLERTTSSFDITVAPHLS